MRKTTRWLVSSAVLAMTFVLLAVTFVFAQGMQASAELKNNNGQVVGNATFAQQADGVHITVQVKNLQPGKHGIHIHTIAKCDSPNFTTAGAHFNPESMKHGLQNPLGPHAGDLPNLDVSQDGTGKMDYTNPRVTLATGAGNSLFKPNGTSLVIHANADDEMTDPTGKSGGRIACGIILATTQPSPSFLDQYWLVIVGVAAIAVIAAAVAVKRKKIV